MKKYVSLIVSLAFLITCSIEVGKNLNTLLGQDIDSVLYIETNQGSSSVPQDDLENFDFSIDGEMELGS